MVDNFHRILTGKNQEMTHYSCEIIESNSYDTHLQSLHFYSGENLIQSKFPIILYESLFIRRYIK